MIPSIKDHAKEQTPASQQKEKIKAKPASDDKNKTSKKPTPKAVATTAVSTNTSSKPAESNST